jgi:hypothetical protein
MSIMDRIDRMMLGVAWVFLGLLFVQNLAAILIKGMNPYLDERGLPHIGAPLGTILLGMVCLWFLRQVAFRLLLALGAGLLMFINVLAVSVAVEGIGRAPTNIRDNFPWIVLMEGLFILGVVSMLWVAIRSPQGSAPLAEVRPSLPA